MKKFVNKIPENSTFEQKGLKGYRFPLLNEEVEVYYVDVSQGHDNYEISKKCTHIYYVLEGEGIFEIGGEQSSVTSSMLIEVPPHMEYTFWGSMKLLLVMNPPFFPENGEVTKPNPNVK